MPVVKLKIGWLESQKMLIPGHTIKIAYLFMTLNPPLGFDCILFDLNINKIDKIKGKTASLSRDRTSGVPV